MPSQRVLYVSVSLEKLSAIPPTSAMSIAVTPNIPVIPTPGIINISDNKNINVRDIKHVFMYNDYTYAVITNDGKMYDFYYDVSDENEKKAEKLVEIIRFLISALLLPFSISLNNACVMIFN